MPGTDYIEYRDPREDNMFFDPVQNFGIGVGLGITGWALRKRGTKQISNFRAAGGMQGLRALPIVGPSGPRSFTMVGGPHGISPAYLKARDSALSGFRNVKAGKAFARTARVFDAMVFAQIGFSAFSSLASLGNATRTSSQEIDAMRRMKIVDHEDQYFDTRQAFTQRQRALQVIHNSRLSLKPQLGGEAQYLHM